MHPSGCGDSPPHVDELLLGCTRTSRDRLALLVLLDCGVRCAELGGIRIRDFDLGRRQLTIFGKGRRSGSSRFAAESP